MKDKWEEVATDLSAAKDWGLVADAKVQRSVEAAEDKRRLAAVAKLDKSLVNKSIHAAGGEPAILDALGSGKTVSGICATLGFSTSSFYDWVERGGQTRADAVSRARTRGAHSIADQTLDIADTATRDDVQVAKLRVDTRFKLAAKMDPETYGERQQPVVNIDLAGITLDALRKREVVTPVYRVDEAGENE
jgi:hypothetical protein